MDKEQVSIVIPTYNSARILGACINSILTHSRHSNYRLIVVDDGSTDNTAEIVKNYPQVSYIRNQQHNGMAHALNTGINNTKNEDVISVHADVIIESDGWIEALQATATSEQNAGIVGVKLIYPDGRIQSVGRAIVNGIGAHTEHANLQMFQPHNPRQCDISEVDSVCGSVMYIRRACLNTIGAIDENYWPIGMWDDDICMAARFHHFKVYVNTGVTAVHCSSVWSPTARKYIVDLSNRVDDYLSLRSHIVKTQRSYWQDKWGWDPLLPDLNEIRRIYKNTEIVWRIGDNMRFKQCAWPPTVDACIVTWNTLPLLKRTLESLAQTEYPADKLRIYIADNNSTDGTKEYLDELPSHFPFPLHVDHLAVNTGCPVGLNWAISRGSGALVARLDDDIVLPKDWLVKLAAGFRKRPFAGVIGPKIINDDDKKAIQCGPYRMYPSIFGHDDEEDLGQADYFSRTTHVRGCCNVYRRDVLEQVGYMDLRFSPSQYDDPDHHLSVLAAGYEVLYDGSVSVLHKLNDGAAKSHAALGNQEGNRIKLLKKWGSDIYTIFEQALDFSREGRYLPDDGNTESVFVNAAPASSFPRQTILNLSHEERDSCKSALQLKNRYHDEYTHVLFSYIDDLTALARTKNRDGYTRDALNILHIASNLAPARADLLFNLAKTYFTVGLNRTAIALLHRTISLVLNDHDLLKVAQTLLNEIEQANNSSEKKIFIAKALPGDGTGEIGEDFDALAKHNRRASNAGLRVLMVNTYESRVAGGDMHQIKKTMQYLQRIGVDVQLNCSPCPDPSGFDLVHVWNAWFPHQTLPQLKYIKVKNPDIPIVLSPIYWDASEKAWADVQYPNFFHQAASEQQLQLGLEQLAQEAKLRRQNNAYMNEANYTGYTEYQKRLLKLVDHMLPQSLLEMKNMAKTLGIEKPFTIVRNAAEREIFSNVSADAFVNRYGYRDFVLSVGLVEPRKNQLMLIQALKGLNIPLVVIGRNYDRNYMKLCLQHAGPNTLFIEHLSHEQLASAYKAAKVHALPSWVECAAFANIEAALSECSLVVSDRTSEPEYFGDNAYYCDPSDVYSIRAAVLTALQQYEHDAPKRDALRKLFMHEYTWEQCAAQTLFGYQKALEHVASRIRGLDSFIQRAEAS